MTTEQNEQLAAKYGQPVKMAIWFGNPYLPWHDPKVPGGKLGQELDINADGHCTVQTMVFNQTIKTPVDGQPTEKLTVPADVAQALLHQALATMNYFGEVTTGQPVHHQATTIWNTDGQSFNFTNYQADPEAAIERLAMKIRDQLNRADLMVFDGNSREDFIEQLTVDYHDHHNYQEHLTLTRADNSIQYQRQVKDGTAVEMTYRLPQDVAPFLDDLNPVDLTSTIPGVPNDAVEDQEQFGHFKCTLWRRQLAPVSFSGDYEQYCLPQPWQQLMTFIHQLIDIPTTGLLLDPDYYGRKRRRMSDVIYLSVAFHKDGHQYNYLTDDDSINVGDWVRVPVGDDDHEAIVQVTDKNYYQKSEVPYPLNKIKTIIQKVSNPEDK
ncbi:hypothetical protein [uncultured Limosilactobacillus sp.]|uniref:hypothetical protein n=1 Tax=uncultured Limosilactobacillus sp. TaxID=2837629 RepID=UPI0025CC7D45|nr:hypothetical protein [uncultured Limosilactobacillus sp.]